MSSLRSFLIVAAILSGIASLIRLSAPGATLHMIELPDWNGEELTKRRNIEHALVELRDDQAVFLNRQEVSLDELAMRIRDLGMRHPIVLFRAGSDVPQTFVLRVFEAIAKAGVTQSRLCLDPSNLARHRKFEQPPFKDSETAISAPAVKPQPGQTEFHAGDCETLTLPPPLY